MVFERYIALNSMAELFASPGEGNRTHIVLVISVWKQEECQRVEPQKL